MAYRIANSNTTLTSTTGWDTVTNTPTLHASTNVTGTTLYTAAYTAPNTSNYATGVAIMIASTGYYTSGDLTLTATLQQYNGSTWSDTSATATIISIPTASGAFSINTWAYFRWGTPYQFTTTSAGYYRIKLVRGTVTGNPSVRADSGGSTIAFMATDDRTGALSSTDNLLVLGHNYSDTTVTWDGTQTIGSGLSAGYASIPTTSITLSAALYIGNHGIVTADTTANVQTTCNGHVVMSWGSTFNIGSSGTEYPNNRTFVWIFTPATSGDYIFVNYNGSTKFYGCAKSSTTLWKAKYSSGVGTAADPLIVNTSVDWSVGDEIYICATSDNTTNYNEGEYRFIKTKNSATSYVLSSTLGGAESAFTYTHNTNAYVVNLERNILFKTNDTAKVFNFHCAITPITNSPSNGVIEHKWVRFETVGISGGTAQTAGISYGSSITQTYLHDYCVIYRTVYCGFWGANNLSTATINGLIICKGASSNYMLYGQAMANKTFDDLFIFDGTTVGLTAYSSSCTFNRLVINAVRKTLSNTTSGAINVTLSNNVQFIDCEISACGTAIALGTSNADVTFTNCDIGMSGKSGNCDLVGNTTYQGQILFDNCNFGSDVFWNTYSGFSYLDFIPGSEVIFKDFNGDTNKHFWYTPAGIVYATGSGLDDTLVRTPGSLNVRLSPENSTNGLSWSFLIPANKNQVVPFSGYFLKNVAMGTDVCTVSLFLPGNPVTGTPDDTVTLSDDVSNAWTGSAVQAVSLAAYYTGTVDSFATVVINAKSTTAGAYLYCADFYNSGDTTTLYDKLAGLTIWYNGKPSPIITQLSLGGIAPAVWGVALSGLTTPGTTGKKLKDSLTTAKFIALK